MSTTGKFWEKPNRSKPPYVTVTKGMRGYFAVLVDDNDQEPIMSGVGSYADEAGAIDEAQTWARAEELEYRGSTT